MNSDLRIVFVLGLGAMGILSSCGNNAGSKKGATATEATPASAWVNPHKGKIWEKENVVKIPLTAVENELRGAVKSVAYKEYELTDESGSNTKTLVDSGYNAYDRAGRLVDQNEYFGDKAPKWHCVYQYDANNKPQEWHLKIFEENMNATTVFKYDDKGNKTEETTTDANKEYNRRAVYKYDARGNQVGANMYDKDGKLKQVITYEYDSRGFQTAYIERDEDSEVLVKLTCAYDANGNKTGGADYSSDTTLESKWVQQNDAQGRRVETDYYTPDGKLLEKRTIKYDNAGYLVEYNTYKPDGSLNEEKSYSFTNEYDQKGNIVKQTEIRWKSGKRLPVTYSEYVISYY